MIIIGDVKNSCRERCISARDGCKIVKIFEILGLYSRGNKTGYSDELEVPRLFLARLIEAHRVMVHGRLSRFLSKNGYVERNYGLCTQILEKMEILSTIASLNALMMRPSFMSNLFHATSLLGMFYLTKAVLPPYWR